MSEQVRVGVSYDGEWPVFRLSHMEDTDPATVERYRAAIERAVNGGAADTERLRNELQMVAEWCESYGVEQRHSLSWAQTVIRQMGKRARNALSKPNTPTESAVNNESQAPND